MHIDDLDRASASLGRRIARWRRDERVGHARMPEKLWQEAIELAGRLGVYQAAQALGLGYATLRRRVERAECRPAVSQGPGEGPTFLEILAPLTGAAVGECILEVQSSDGDRRVRVEMRNVSPQSLVTIVRDLVA